MQWSSMSTAERVKVATEGRLAGLAASRIAAAHGTTRNAVIGYWSRWCKDVPCCRVRFGLKVNAGRTAKDRERERQARKAAERARAKAVTPNLRLAAQALMKGAKHPARQRMRSASASDLNALSILKAVPLPALTPLEPMPEPRRVSLMDLAADDCRWPLGDPKEASFAFCGLHRASERPYCAWHCRVAYTAPAKRSERKRPNYSVRHVQSGAWVEA